MNESKIKVEAAVQHGPSANDPLAQRIGVFFSIRGEETITVDDPGRGDDFGAAVRGGFGYKQMGAISGAALEFADRVYAQIFAAGFKATHGTDFTGTTPKHPSIELRHQIAGLEAQVTDLQGKLTVAETQRDELRRLFVEPQIITGIEKVVQP